MWQRISSGVLVAMTCASPAFGQGTPASAAGRCFARDFQTDVRSAIAGYAKVAGIPGVSIGVVVRVPKTHFFGMVGVATAIIMILGCVGFFLNKKRWEKIAGTFENRERRELPNDVREAV